jgi:phosphate transport system substrate-binding protein
MARIFCLRSRRATLGLALPLMCMLAGSVGAEEAHVSRIAAPAHQDLESYAAQTSVQGRLSIAGSDTMQPVLSKLAMEFRRRHPEMKIAVQGSRDSKLSPEDVFLTGLSTMRRGDGDTAGHMGAYDVQLLALSRQLTEQELKRFESRYGYAPTAVAIAQDAVAVYVNQDNPISQLTLSQVDAIFSSTRKRGLEDIREWGQLGLDGRWEHAAIRLYGRDQRSIGTLPFFKQVVLHGGEFKKSLTPEPGSASVIVTVGKDREGIGYSGIGFQTSAVKAVPLSEGPSSPAIMPSIESVMDGQYPLSRPLYLYVNKDPNEEWEPKILEFLRFINSREGQETVARTGVYPLSSLQVADNLAMIGSKRLLSALRY